MHNAVVDALENATTGMSPLRDMFTVEILYQLSIPGNINNLRVFDDDQQILYFMANNDVLKDTVINEDEHE